MGDLRHETLLILIHQHDQNKCTCFNIFFLYRKGGKDFGKLPIIDFM